MTSTRDQLLEAHAGLPEAYQPAWGLAESMAIACRQCEDRFAVIRDAVAAFPADRPLRILDIGCAQGYFSIGLQSELRSRGRAAAVIGVDSLEENVRFCRALAEHHGLDVCFIHDRFDGRFLERHDLADFDIVLALNVLHHMRDLDGAAGAGATLAAIRAHATALLCEIAQPEEALDWVADWHASDDALLRDFVFRRKLGKFETHLTEVRRPLYVCSNRLAYVGNRWFAFERMLDRAHPGVSDGFAGQRRFFIGPDALVKSVRVAGEFGAFNRAELEAEAQVLQILTDEPSRYPPLLGESDDGDERWLARGALPGALISELIEDGTDFDRDALVRALLGELAHLQERGYHHADLRLWNMLWHESGLRLIDFGSMTREPSPLHRVALAAVLAEIARGEISGAQPWYAAVHPLHAYPRAWHGLIRYLLGCAQAKFSFAEAQQVLDGSVGIPSIASETLSVCAEVLEDCAAAQVEGFARLQEHVKNLECSFESARTHAETLGRDLRRVTAEAKDERRASSKALAVASRYADSLKVQIERESSEARAYADSLKVQIGRQTGEALQERTAAQAALADATGYARTLEQERQQLKEHVQRLEIALGRMQQRFRLLRPIWPRDNKDQA